MAKKAAASDTISHTYASQPSRGRKGRDGEKGEQGLVGPQGARGLVGPQGRRGPQGERGPQGAQGLTGNQELLRWIVALFLLTQVEVLALYLLLHP